MKPSTRLDSVVFQLTPTRTRFDLVIAAKGKTEKIGSGLLNPFLAHLKTAQDQIDKGGYSILLQPGPDTDTAWFTKGTVERFVRFVSTPEILERVYSLESEILQLEKAIAIQGNNDMGLATVEQNQVKFAGNKEEIKSTTVANDEKAIVLYKPEAHPPEVNGSMPEGGNSKVQLLKVLETRKTVLQKEQGMAFARAVAASFDSDHMEALLSFADCFGASRLLDACFRFIDLWKQKHESGEWVEVEAAEAVAIPPDFSAMNASGIMLSSMANQQIEPHGELAEGTNGKPGPDSRTDERCFTNPQAQVGQPENYQGQFPYPMFPTWPANSPPGAFPVYQPYPVQGVPYYQPYPGCSPFYPPPHPHVEDSEHSNSRRGRRRRHYVDNGESNSESEEFVSESGSSQTRGSRKKAGKSDKKKAGMVVVRNINYVASNEENSSECESEIASDSETGKNFSSLKRKGSNGKHVGELNSKVEEPIFGKASEGGHWDAFQSFLLRDSDEKSRGDDQSMFGLEKNTQTKRGQNAGGDDSLALIGRDPLETQNGRTSELDTISEPATRMSRPSNDEWLLSKGEGHQMDNRMNVEFTEMNGRKLAYRNKGNDDFMAVGREGQPYASHSADPLSINVSRSRENIKGDSQDMTDESFIIPFRSISLDQVRSSDRTAIDLDSELPSAIQKSEDSSNKTGHQVNYEPDYLSLMPEQGIEKRSIGYDPSLEYEMQVHINDSSSLENQNKEVVADAKQSKKSRMTPDSSDKKKTVGLIRKGKPSKSSPLDDARVRAEKLRSYKADLQKLKKEKEEEQQKRLEVLKRERQKRIAARNGSRTAPSPPSQQSKRQFPTKTSISSHKGSKFSDKEPGLSSPLQRSKLRTVSLGTPESQKASKTTRSANDIQIPGNRLTRSVPSLPDGRKETKEVTPDPKASMARIRRLSEPKSSGNASVASVKTRTPPSVSKPKVLSEPENKKIAAIINLDKSKAASLSELNIKTSKGPLKTGQTKSGSEEISHKVNKHQNNEVENPIVDKTIVVFEPEKPSIAVMDLQKEQYINNVKVENVESLTGYATVRAPTSLPDGIDIGPIRSQLLEQPRSSEVNTTFTDTEPPKTSNAQTAEMPYLPPFARLSSIDDPCTQKAQYGKPPLLTSQTAVIDAQNDKALVSGFTNLKVEQISEALEKTHAKDPSKGFKRLLKFGKKNHSSAAGEQSLESDETSVNGSEINDKATNAASCSEARSLKNLISQYESAAGGTTHKSSRHFSILSPFRSKTSEKKSLA